MITIRHRALLGGLGLVACTNGGDRAGPERLLTIHPRLVSSYILTTVQQAILDLEPLREFVCVPEKNLVLMCARAERTRAALQMTQTQLTRLLGDAPEGPPSVVNPGSIPGLGGR